MYRIIYGSRARLVPLWARRSRPVASRTRRCGAGEGGGGGGTKPLTSSGCTNLRSSILARLAKQALDRTRTLTMYHTCLSQHIGTPVGLGSLDEDTKGVASCSFFDSLFVSASGTGAGTPRLTALGASGGIEALTHPAVPAHSAPTSLLQHLPQNVASQVVLCCVVRVCAVMCVPARRRVWLRGAARGDCILRAVLLSNATHGCSPASFCILPKC